jgi:glyoxylase-like metal-dependent hydrolase (beta-lactamase superfamily II)
MASRAKILPVNDNIILIDDSGESPCYLVTEKSCTADRYRDWTGKFKDFISGLTKLPLTVMNIHGHIDHICSSVIFEEAWLHPKDFKLHDEHSPSGTSVQTAGNPALKTAYSSWTA